MNFLVDWAGLATSFYITISMLWLGVMVLLAGNRKTTGAWMTGIGFILSSLFFTSHTAILGRGLSTTGFGMDFWWWVSWTPAVVAPFSWYAVILWYSGYRPAKQRFHTIGIATVLSLALLIIVLFTFANPLPAYHNLVGWTIISTPTIFGLPAIVVVYGLFCLCCFLLPIDLIISSPYTKLSPGLKLSLQRVSRIRARPWLIATSVFLLIATVLMMWTALWILNTRPIPSLSNIGDVLSIKLFDLAVAACVALAVTSLGRAVVAYEVFTSMPLPRSSFFTHWRATVLFSASFSVLISWMIVIDLRSVYSLMLSVTFMTIFYALYSWSSIRERENFVEKLHPFLAPQNLYSRVASFREEQGKNLGGAYPSLDEPYEVFTSLCNGVLNTTLAALIPSDSITPLIGPYLVYPQNSPVSQQRPGFPPFSDILPNVQFSDFSKNNFGVWEHNGTSFVVIPLWNDNLFSGLLILGEKGNRNPYSDEEIRIARMGGERILDSLAGTELARLAMGLLRQRIAQVKVLEGQGRRILHDDILPSIHAAILLLTSQATSDAYTAQAIEVLTANHRKISDLIRSVPDGMQGRIAQSGLVEALRVMITEDFTDQYTQASILVDPGAREISAKVPLFILEVIYFACKEITRNAMAHGRRNKADPIHLSVEIRCKDEDFMVIINDDGQGILARNADPDYQTSRGGSGSGLRFHSAMLAAVGARLEINSSPGSGTTVTICLPGKTIDFPLQENII
jgi:signal transduction histidine kinase